MTDKPKSKRGFASFSPEKLLAAARAGGAAVPADKRSFAVDRSVAVSAGRKGGLAKRKNAVDAAKT